MSLGRLLTTGRSLAGGREIVSRYRLNKAQLPKFSSQKNPFGTGDAKTEAPVSAAATNPRLMRNAENNAQKSFSRPRTLAEMAERAPQAIGIQALRAARWLGEWGQKLNPLPLLAKRRGPARSAVSNFTAPVIQAELSLDTVKVVRNDLSDADFEVVLVTRPAAGNGDNQLIMATAGGEPAGNPFSRLSDLVFGGKSA